MSGISRIAGDATVAAIARDIFAAPAGLQVSELATDDRSVSTVTRGLTALRRCGVIVDGPRRKGAGRPATPVQAPTEVGIVGISVLGVDGEPSTLIGVVTDLASQTVHPDAHLSLALPMRQRHDPAKLAEAIATAAAELVDKTRDRITVVGLGVSIGGYVRDGVLERFPGTVWPAFDLQGALHRSTGLAVRVDNDASAFATELAVHAKVPARGSIAVLCMFGDGIGGAWIVDGRVRRGARGAAMEPGHLAVAPDSDLFNDRALHTELNHKCRCGAIGCVEAYAALSRIRRALASANGGEGLALEAAAVKPTEADEVATKAFQRAGYALGRGIANIVNTCDPDQVVLHAPTVLAKAKRGSLAEAWQEMLYGTVAASDFGNRAQDLDEVKKRVSIRELTNDDVEFGTAVASAALVSESLLDQIAGREVRDTSLISSELLLGGGQSSDPS